MKLISHRGNVAGPMESWENEPTYIDLAIKKGYDVEIDVWHTNGQFFLGHDKPLYGVDLRWFRDRVNRVWIHCKDLETIEHFNEFSKVFNYFYHQTDDVTITSKGYLWAHPNYKPIKKSIAVLPEIHNWDVTDCYGVCSDYIEKYNK